MYGQIINEAAIKHNIRPDVLAALIMQESSGNHLAVRYEPAFYKRYIEGKPLSGYVPKRITEETERQLRSMSFGLGQVMGQVARENGYNNESLVGLVDPMVSVQLAALILAKNLIRANGDYHKALLRYNGGGDPNYPNKVMARIANRDYLKVMV
jgi:soluble lytic murein transglycosylase-like protein